MIFDYYIEANTNGRKTDPKTNTALITHREIWKKAPKAAARKATAQGVNGISIDETNGKFYIFQVSGYTPERGIFCDILNERGQVINK